MIKIIIAGSRSFNDYELLKHTLDNLIRDKQNVEIVSGTAKGADSLGEKYANEKGFAVKKFPANWEEYGKSAGYLRNKQMAIYADHAVIFWDGSSRGTENMIHLCHIYTLNYRVIEF